MRAGPFPTERVSATKNRASRDEVRSDLDEGNTSTMCLGKCLTIPDVGRVQGDRNDCGLLLER